MACRDCLREKKKKKKRSMKCELKLNSQNYGF